MWSRTIIMALAAAFFMSAGVASAGTLEKRQDAKASSNVDFVAVFAVNKSMDIFDFSEWERDEGIRDGVVVGSRLEMAKKIFVEQIAPALTEARGTVVTYAGQAVPMVPEADDAHEMPMVVKTVRAAVIRDNAPASGANIAGALDTAVKQLDDLKPREGNRRKVIFLFTDGRNSAGSDADALAAGERVHASGAELVVIGLGNIEKWHMAFAPASWLFGGSSVRSYCEPCALPVPSFSADGMFQGYAVENGEMVRVEQNVELLSALAARSGGKYVSLQLGEEVSLGWK